MALNYFKSPDLQQHFTEDTPVSHAVKLAPFRSITENYFTKFFRVNLVLICVPNFWTESLDQELLVMAIVSSHIV